MTFPASHSAKGYQDNPEPGSVGGNLIPEQIRAIPGAKKRGPQGQIYTKRPLRGPNFKPQRYVVRP